MIGTESEAYHRYYNHVWVDHCQDCHPRDGVLCPTGKQLHDFWKGQEALQEVTEEITRSRKAGVPLRTIPLRWKHVEALVACPVCQALLHFPCFAKGAPHSARIELAQGLAARILNWEKPR